MRVEIQFYSRLRDVVGRGELDRPIEKGTTVESLLADLYESYPGLEAWDSQIRVAVDVEYVQRDFVLSDGDKIAIMPPSQGG